MVDLALITAIIAWVGFIYLIMKMQDMEEDVNDLKRKLRDLEEEDD